MISWLLAVAAIAGALWLSSRLRRRYVTIWLPSYLAGTWAGRRERPGAGQPRPGVRGVTHVLFCIADHFEPGVHGASETVERRRVAHWVYHYPRLFSEFRDADGRPPRHTFFYPAEQYRAEYLERLAQLTTNDFGEVEIHLHHNDDTSVGLRRTLLQFIDQLRSHGHLGSHRLTEQPQFGFVHGDWCLDNSLPTGKQCGVNDELRVLTSCGCYADFTMPAAPSPAQSRRINSIYYAVDDPAQPRSHDDGIEVGPGRKPIGDLMIIQGPLCIRWTGGKFGILPRLENGNVDGRTPITPARVDAWINTRVCLPGRPDWVFVKVHTHGCLERNWPVIFGESMQELHRHLARRYNDGERYQLHYVTAREMYNIIKAAEQGLEGNPNAYRDSLVTPPARVAAASARWSG